MECVFCKIVEKKIPSATIYEDADVMAFLDINPRFKGHALVIPKIHVTTLDELGDEVIAHLFVLVKHVADTLRSNLGAKGYNIISNNGRVAGQVVPHLHIHVVPRYEDEKQGIGFEAAFPVDKEAKKQLDELARKARIDKELKPHFLREEKKEDKTAKAENEKKKEDEESAPKLKLYDEDSYFNDDGTPRFV
jgi:histidine triad (HIT) family protein